MSKDNTANDTMRKYETDQDAGDANTETSKSTDPRPAETTPAPDTGNSGGDDPIPMATPQSPVQTEDSPEVRKDSDSDDNSPEVRSNKGDQARDSGGIVGLDKSRGTFEYREV